MEAIRPAQGQIKIKGKLQMKNIIDSAISDQSFDGEFGGFL